MGPPDGKPVLRTTSGYSFVLLVLGLPVISKCSGLSSTGHLKVEAQIGSFYRVSGGIRVRRPLSTVPGHNGHLNQFFDKSLSSVIAIA